MTRWSLLIFLQQKHGGSHCQAISKQLINSYLGTSVSLKNVCSCESLRVPYSMRVCRAKSKIVSMGVFILDTVRWAARFAVYVALMIITANQKTDTVILPDHDLGCSAPCRTYAFHDDQTEFLRLRVSASLMASGLSCRSESMTSKLNKQELNRMLY